MAKSAAAKKQKRQQQQQTASQQLDVVNHNTLLASSPQRQRHTIFQYVLLLQALLTIGPGLMMLTSPTTMLAQSMVPDLSAVSHSEIYGFASDTMRINGMLLCVIGVWALRTRWRVRQMWVALTAADDVVRDYCVAHALYATLGMCVYGHFVMHTFVSRTPTHAYMKPDVSIGGMATSFVFLVLWSSCLLGVFDCRSGRDSQSGGSDAAAPAVASGATSAMSAMDDNDSDDDVVATTTTRRRRAQGQQSRQTGPQEVTKAA